MFILEMHVRSSASAGGVMTSLVEHLFEENKVSFSNFLREQERTDGDGGDLT